VSKLNTYKVEMANRKERECMDVLDVGAKIILKWIVKEWVWRTWTEFMWLFRIRLNGEVGQCG
jgi:hypothetical protein